MKNMKKNTNDALKPLKSSELRKTINPFSLNCKMVSEIEALSDLPGQTRAMEALEFFSEIKSQGYNCFVMGSQGSGRRTLVTKYLVEKSKSQRAPDDWAYVFNFQSSHKPIALRLPAGIAEQFKDSMEVLIDDLKSAIPEVFRSDEYRDRLRSINLKFQENEENAFEKFNKKAQLQDVAVLNTPLGFALSPTNKGELIKPEVFSKFPRKEREAIEDKISKLQLELTSVVEQLPKLQREHRAKTRELNTEMIGVVVDATIEVIANRFKSIDVIQKWVTAVRQDLVDNTELFLEQEVSEDTPSLPKNKTTARHDPKFNRYRVNIMVSNDKDGDHMGSPVVFEEHPTLARVIGRVEHFSQFGALITDFTMIRAGALHQANGGYLVLEARKLLSEPFAWDALKRAIKGEAIKIISAIDEMGLTSTISLEPEPIPLNAKIVLIGDRVFYYLLCAYDPDFSNLFKVEADFNDELARTDENVDLYLQLLSAIIQKEKLIDFNSSAAARVLDEAIRMSDDSEKLTLNIEKISDLLRQASYQAVQKKRKHVGVSDVKAALTAQALRAGRIKERAYEAIARDTLLIDVEGKKVGQINGLSVLDLGNFCFGKPSRITARVRVGSGKVIDIERETELGGPLHSKGVLILSSFLSSNFTPDIPMSVQASIVFEQSYGGIDGDSASSAELYALISALSELPINQAIAVTGSVNQMGEVQAIGGVNEKIEGFFDICMAKGLTGEQGVMIPRANIKHLMIREDVVKSVKDGKFNIFAVENIDEGIELLTDAPSGERRKNGHFTDGTVYKKVEDKLRQFAMAKKEFSQKSNYIDPSSILEGT
jgi:lon-related putative ATP-dependent protease